MSKFIRRAGQSFAGLAAVAVLLGSSAASAFADGLNYSTNNAPSQILTFLNAFLGAFLVLGMAGFAVYLVIGILRWIRGKESGPMTVGLSVAGIMLIGGFGSWMQSFQALGSTIHL